jgi:hypothetical protein
MSSMASFISFVTLVLGLAASASCPDISGKYVSEKVGYSKRIIIVNQKSCTQFEVTFQYGAVAGPEQILADGKPYTYFAHDKSGNGSLVPNGQPIETSSKDSYRIASFNGSTLKLLLVWDYSNSKTCVPEVKYQSDCSVLQFTYAVSCDKMVETQIGQFYSMGNYIPETIEYKKVK